MKTMIIFLTVSLFLFSTGCNSEKNSEITKTEWQHFGKDITAKNASDINSVVTEFEVDTEKEFKIKGTISEVCQKKGCWTIIKTDDDKNVRITFENYSFFLPKDATGREIIAEGVGFKSVTSVDELRHYAQDAGASEEELLTINEPEESYKFEARGVLLR